MFYARDERPLFAEKSGLTEKMRLVAQAVANVGSLPDEMLAPERQAEALGLLVRSVAPTVPTLKADEADYKQVPKPSVVSDVFGDRATRDIATVEFHVPFEGDQEIFRMQPQTFTTSAPRGRIERGYLVLDVTDSGNPESIKREYDHAVAEVEKYLQWHREMWARFSEEASAQVFQAISVRRQQLNQKNATAAGLQGFGFKPRQS